MINKNLEQKPVNYVLAVDEPILKSRSSDIVKI